MVTRDFYGALRVVESSTVRRLYHGSIEHGSQFLDPLRRMSPTTYYGPPSGAGIALRYCCEGPRRIGIVGLGAGTLAAYGRPGDVVRFYEIDPEVIRLAQSQFSYLKNTPAVVEIAPGDARLSLEHESSGQFDVLAIDAFSGDAIPLHLLTTEAFAVYRRHLKPLGILAVHVSNQFLDLAPVVGELATASGMPTVQIQSGKDEGQDLASATWVLATCSRDFLGRAEVANVAREIPAPRKLRLWTDDYNNLLEVLRW
jgi:SAM-dependent methyltransferase